MAQKSGNHVKPPVHDGGENATDTGSQTKTTKQHLAQHHGEETGSSLQDLAEQHHGEETGSSLQDDKKIGQHNGAGRPPLMKK